MLTSASTSPHPPTHLASVVSHVSVKDDAVPYVALLRSGNRIALGRFYDEHVDVVSAVIWKVLGGHRDHEDLVQETFYHAMKGVSGYRGDAHGLRAWVVRIAVVRCYRKLRYQKVRKWLIFLPAEELSEPRHVSSQDPHIAMALRRAYEVLDELPLDERVALSLRLFSAMTIPEIVEAMGRSRSTVKRLIASGHEYFLERATHDTILSEWITHTGAKV